MKSYRRPLTLRAWTDQVEDLSPNEAEQLAGSRLVGLARQGGTWVLKPGSLVGVELFESIELHVMPKIAVPRLMFLLSYSESGSGWADETVAFAEDADLFAAVAHGFATHAERAIRPVPLAGYREVRETDWTMRGRLRISDQISRGKGLALPMELEYDEFTTNIIENQMIHGAVAALLSMPLVDSRARARLRAISAMLVDVERTRPAKDVVPPKVNRLNSRYKYALPLAALILRGMSVDPRLGSTAHSSFIFDMNKVFEEFLEQTLTAALQRFGGTVVGQYTGAYLDEERTIALRPDLVWRRKGEIVAAIDAKYKALDGLVKHGDAYQMLAYQTAFEVGTGFLVYAKDSGSTPAAHRISNTDFSLRVAVVDLEKQPADVLGQIDQLSSEIAEVSIPASHPSAYSAV